MLLSLRGGKQKHCNREKGKGFTESKGQEREARKELFTTNIDTIGMLGKPSFPPPPSHRSSSSSLVLLCCILFIYFKAKPSFEDLMEERKLLLCSLLGKQDSLAVSGHEDHDD